MDRLYLRRGTLQVLQGALMPAFKVEPLEVTMKVTTYQGEACEPLYREFGFESKEGFFEAMIASSPELQRLRALLQGGTMPDMKVTIAGPMGCGKTTLAAVIAKALKSVPGCEVIVWDDATGQTDLPPPWSDKVLAGKKIEIHTVNTPRVQPTDDRCCSMYADEPAPAGDASKVQSK